MKINGNSGSLDGSKILASIVHAIVTPDLLSQFTMTGKTGNKDVTKEKFKIYVNIIDIIWRVASAADASYTKHKFTNDFTYKIIKYAYRFRYVQNKLSSHSVYHCTINKKKIFQFPAPKHHHQMLIRPKLPAMIHRKSLMCLLKVFRVHRINCEDIELIVLITANLCCESHIVQSTQK